MHVQELEWYWAIPDYLTYFMTLAAFALMLWRKPTRREH